MEASGKRYIAHPGPKDEFRIWNLSDLHLTNASCSKAKLKEDIERIREDPYSFWFGGGDYADYIGTGDVKRFDSEAVDETIKLKHLGRLGARSVKVVKKTLKPIAHKCLGMLLGNHEKQYQRRNAQEDLHKKLCRKLNVYNLGYSAFVDIVFLQGECKKPVYLGADIGLLRAKVPCSEFRFFLHHGAGAAQSKGGKINRLIQFMKQFEADVYMMGHVHDRTGTRETFLGSDAECKRIVERDRIGVISGSYLKTYSERLTGYGEQKGYSPTTLGAAWVCIKPATRELRAEI